MPHHDANNLQLQPATGKTVPVNIVMGELGSGKTTIIMHLVKQVAGDNHKVVWLKNEYGDVNVDGKLAKEAGIATEEIMNGCLCCTAIGNLENAIEEVLKLEPDRLIVETAGSAHPAPIVMELKRFPDLLIDSILEVFDAVNFNGFADKTIIGRSHSQYVDFLVLNKTGLVDERRMDQVIDMVNDNYDGTPLLKTADGQVPAEVVFGNQDKAEVGRLSHEKMHHDAHRHEDHVQMQAFSWRTTKTFDRSVIEKLIKELPVGDVYRTKGIVQTPNGWEVMNGVANRVTWQPFSGPAEETELLFIGPYAKDQEGTVKRVLEGS
jgi:G3E family GTPase